MINQFQMVDVNNSTANSSINVVVDERSTNLRSDRLLALIPEAFHDPI
jgi:hypothetical protein